MFYKHWIKTSSMAVLFLLYSNVSFSDQWVDIAGVPNPEFGIVNEAETRPANWSSEISGFYYIDNSNVNSSDDNTYGNPLKPRQTIPNPIPAGSVVEVHGLYDKSVTLNSQGTKAQPVYVKGRSKTERAIFGRTIDIKGSYLTVENFLSKAQIPETSHSIQIPEGNDHITLRYAELSGEGSLERNGSIEIGSWGYTGSDIVQNVLIYKMNIHDVGDRYANFDQDAHAVMVHGTSENVWILHNTINKASGDGVQIEAQHSRGHDKIQKIYLAKNTIYDNKQSGLWIKHAKKVVISSNTIYGMTPSDSSSGQCTGYQYSSDNFWFINNTLYNCAQGIMAASDDGGADERGSVYYIGNVISKINSNNPSNPHQAGGITLRMGSTNHYVVGNTIDDTDVALTAPISSGKVFIYNNIFSNRNESANSDIYVGAAAENSEIDNNIFYNKDGVKIEWNGGYDSLLNFINATSQCRSCIDKDPKFTDAASPDYHLTLASPAINQGKDIEQMILTPFRQSFDFDLSLQKDSFPVPVNAWDIGAFEVNENISITKPQAPSNIIIN
jgi:hypothetical protein